MKHDYKSLRSIIKKYKIFNIPYYQRRYVWNSVNNGRNLYKFIDDICNEYNESQQSTYFIGSLAFCSSDEGADVVDGQQRLTSLIFLLSILADVKCSDDFSKEHQKLVYHNDKFILQEKSYLTNEITGVLGYNANYDGTGDKVKLDETKSKIIDQLNRNYKKKPKQWFNDLYDYILDNVYVITIEYSNSKDALRYFLNINSLSVELTQPEIFYTILSQALTISHNTVDIYSVIKTIDRLSKDYKWSKTSDKTKEDIIYIFLNSYYTKDAYINELDEIGVGKWMSFYHTDVFGDPIIAAEFCKVFLKYLEDLEQLLKLLEFKSSYISKKSPLYLSYSLLSYEKYSDLIQVLLTIFKNRHNYSTHSLYDDTGINIDIDKFEDVSRRLNLTLIYNYIRNTNKRLDLFVKNIELDIKGDPKLSLNDILVNMNIETIFTLNYLTNPQSDPKINLPDNSRMIKIIFALQEAFLNSVASNDTPMYAYFSELIDGQKFTIEHLYSIKEYIDANRLSKWREKGMFSTPNQFDIERSKFENLSILDLPNNSSANDKIIYDKLETYKHAAPVFSNENLYLIQSFVRESEFYNNNKIQTLHLPSRYITNINSNTWEHSNNNKEFNRQLLKLALNELVK